MVQSARPAITGYLHDRLGGSLLLITSHPHRAEHLVQELSPWVDTAVEYFPAFETLPYERARVDMEVLAKRQAIVGRLQSESLVVVAPVRALVQAVSLPREPHMPHEHRVGDFVDVDDVLEKWVHDGYEAVTMVEDIGTFARRGGIVDVFPIGERWPVRIEFFGREIESLRRFDPVNQRSLEPIPSVSVVPMTSLDQTALETAVAILETLDTDSLTEHGLDIWMADVERLRSGTVEDQQFFSPYLDHDASLLDVLLSAATAQSGEIPVVVLDETEDIRAQAEDLVKQAREFQQDLESRGELPKGMRSPLLDVNRLQQLFGSARRVAFQRGGGQDTVDERIFTAPPEFSGKVRDFLHALRGTGPVAMPVSLNDAIVVTSYQHSRLAELLATDDIPVQVVDRLESIPHPGMITIVKGSLAEGWIASPLQLAFYTDHELFGWSRPRLTPRRRRAAKETFFSEFKPDDYVVHIEHGIGQLIGTSKMTDEGTEREYLVVQYAGTDRLYVPTDQLDRLTRYVGMGEAKPALNKLGGGEWARAKSRARLAAEDMAEELIGLYAQREAQGGHAFTPDTPWQQELEASFPYEETPDQLQAVKDVKGDMEEGKVMDRLVVADVGYGKTEVAVRAAFKAVFDGMQVAVLVPTTVLAQQHMETFHERLDAFPVRVELLSRFRTPREQKETLRKVKDGEVDIIIGTHRLLSKDVVFKNLGLLVVDEEQRFGVRHKERLKQLRAAVDVLTLTATPIPRTLHMSLTGIRDVSIIQTPPEGRLPIKTYLQPYEDRLVHEAIIRELERDGQVYFVHNRVAGIEALAQKLRSLVPEARILVGHGQMPEDQLEKVMLAFAHHEADVLLCSTIIESGLDIPNVNTIVIDHAEGLGLAQLYQLRGRVGRSVNQAYAYLLYPRDVRLSRDAFKRMEAVFEATELGAGFKIAMTDLEIRGAGNLLGSQQSGHVAAVGFDLYTNLLKDAIDRMRGQPKDERPQITVDLPFDVLIPITYVPDERERLAMYRRIATLESESDIQPFEDELRDRFGVLPRSVRNLLTQVRVKFLAEKAHVTAVVLRGEALVFRGERRILFDRVNLYKRFGMKAHVSENVLRIPKSEIGADWLDGVIGVLNDTITLRERQDAAVAAKT